MINNPELLDKVLECLEQDFHAISQKMQEQIDALPNCVTLEAAKAQMKAFQRSEE